MTHPMTPDRECECGHDHYEHGHFFVECFALRKRTFFQALIGSSRFCPCPAYTPKQKEKEPAHE